MPSGRTAAAQDSLPEGWHEPRSWWSGSPRAAEPCDLAAARSNMWGSAADGAPQHKQAEERDAVLGRREPRISQLSLKDWNWDQSGYSSAIVGTVVNESSRHLRMVRIEFSIMDRQGNLLGTTSDYVSSLTPGESSRGPVLSGAPRRRAGDAGERSKAEAILQDLQSRRDRNVFVASRDVATLLTALGNRSSPSTRWSSPCAGAQCSDVVVGPRRGVPSAAEPSAMARSRSAGRQDRTRDDRDLRRSHRGE